MYLCSWLSMLMHKMLLQTFWVSAALLHPDDGCFASGTRIFVASDSLHKDAAACSHIAEETFTSHVRRALRHVDNDWICCGFTF